MPLDYIYGFIYRYRQFGLLKAGEEVRLHLPTKNVNFKLLEKKKIRIAKENVDAYYMKSLTGNYKVWFDESHKRIPLMIDGALGGGHASMIMKSYSDGKK